MSDPTRRLTPVVRLAPAKLNLTLAVVGRRTDGYHLLHSVMVKLALSDRLSLAVLPGADDRDTLHVTGFDTGPPEGNLVLRAIDGARAALPRGTSAPALAVRLEKRIPVAAGLAGGSSDAAAALDGALEAWAEELDTERRLAIAAHVGSDVPFFTEASNAALVEGRGERVTPLHGVREAGAANPPGILLVCPNVPAHTAAVFAAWSAGAMAEPGIARRTSEHFASEFGSGLTSRALLERAGVLASANDLIPAAAAVVPGLVAFRRALARLLSRPIGLSGSGPTLWALYPFRGDAEDAVAAVGAALADGTIDPPGGPPTFVAATTIETNRSDG